MLNSKYFKISFSVNLITIEKMFAKPTYLNRVALIESEQEPKRPNIPAAMFNRSPLRDHESNRMMKV